MSAASAIVIVGLFQLAYGLWLGWMAWGREIHAVKADRDRYCDLWDDAIGLSTKAGGKGSSA